MINFSFYFWYFHNTIAETFCYFHNTMAETKEEQKIRAQEIYKRLDKMYPNAKCALYFTNAFELMVATILSAQCTDKRVNMISPGLFKKYPSPKAFAEANLQELEQEIYSTGFYRNKAKNIVAASQKIVIEFKGKMPDNMNDLLTLPGIARKSANVVLYVWYGKNEGVVVDTHVKRISNRLALTKNKTPEKIEQDLMKLYNRRKWGPFAYYLVVHGRTLCTARNPKCIKCPLQPICPGSKEFL